MIMMMVKYMWRSETKRTLKGKQKQSFERENENLILRYFRSLFVDKIWHNFFSYSSHSSIQYLYWYSLYTAEDVNLTSNIQDQMMTCEKISLTMMTKEVVRMIWLLLISRHFKSQLVVQCLSSLNVKCHL